MGNKDVKTNRERKRDSKKKENDKSGKYSTKHIRINQERQQNEKKNNN
tara:strand:- start:701 stop:844 length:144 start_codon:yes stop_codon:yes gene_type:complete